MGWMGTESELLYALSIAGADKTKEGKYIVSGNIISYLGLGEEFVVDDDAKYYIEGRPCSIANLLNSTSYGLREVVVI